MSHPPAGVDTPVRSADPCDVSIVIVSWNCWEMLRTCLDHVLAARTTLAYEIIVVDNDSADGTAERVEAAYPSAMVIRSGGNLGFARGNNLGFAKARGRHVLMLNPDAFMTDHALLEDLVRWLDDHPEFGALGCRIVFPDGSHQIGDAGYRPTAAAMINWGLGLASLSSRFKGVFMTARPGVRTPIEIDWVCGAFVLMRRSTLDLVGGRNENFFLYGEDVEWGCRARDAGVRIAYLPWRDVVHVQSGTQFKDNRPTVSTKWLDGLVELHRHLDPQACWRCVRAMLSIGFFARAALYRIAGSLGARPTLVNKSRALVVFARHAWSMRG